jgi:myo-inositol-1-phosphate synthase
MNSSSNSENNVPELDNETISHSFTERFTEFNENGTYENKLVEHTIETEATVPKLGLMLVGLGGNNGSTLLTGLLAHKLKTSWETKTGIQHPTYHGSFTQCATTKVGMKRLPGDGIADVFKPVKELLPMVNPTDIEVTGWDISNKNMFEACKRSGVLEPDLVNQLGDQLKAIVPMKAAFNAEFIAANQSDRVDHIIEGTNAEVIETIREDIRKCKERNDKVIILWTANTEMMCYPEIETIEELEKSISENKSLPSSVLYCYAAIKEKCLYLNGSPQNTFHPAILTLAEKEGGLLAGNDFKSGQTRFKTAMSDFLIGAGLRLSSVVSYNHLGNNDGKNLSEDKCFQSKRISKQGCLDDAINGNEILYPKHDKEIDHDIIIKYIPFVGDSKRALDEYSSKIFMGGINTISTYNICEDSLLAVPIMIDMVVLGELFTRMSVNGKKFGPVLSYLSFFFKAPSTNHPEYVINSFNRQRETIVNLLKAASGITPDDATLLSFGY